MKSSENSCIFNENSIFHENYSRATTSDDGTSNPRSDETFSIFGDASCGEPLFAQHLIVDFTPNDVIDSDFVQKKICAFWDFIDNTPEIKNLRVEPEVQNFPKSVHTPPPVAESSKSDIKDEISIDPESKAVTMLKFAEEKGLIDRIFESKMVESHCTLGSREYKELDYEVQLKKKEKKKCGNIICPCTEPCETRPTLGKSVSQMAHNRLLNEMHDWSLKHPKSMDPPGHAPSLQHAIFQRRPFH